MTEGRSIPKKKRRPATVPGVVVTAATLGTTGLAFAYSLHTAPPTHQGTSAQSAAIAAATAREKSSITRLHAAISSTEEQIKALQSGASTVSDPVAPGSAAATVGGSSAAATSPTSGTSAGPSASAVAAPAASGTSTGTSAAPTAAASSPASAGAATATPGPTTTPAPAPVTTPTTQPAPAPPPPPPPVTATTGATTAP